MSSGASNATGINRLANRDYGYPYLTEEYLSFDKLYYFGTVNLKHRRI